MSTTVPWQGMADDKPTQRARTAAWGPLFNVVWLVPAFVAAMALLNVFGWEGDTPADEWGVGQWVFNVLFNFLLVPLPMLVALAVGLHSRRHGADGAVARRAVRVNAGFVAAWWALMAWGLVQDFVE